VKVSEETVMMIVKVSEETINDRGTQEKKKVRK
jgi:hypothetical protein